MASMQVVLLLIGPTGSGKTRFVRRLPGLKEQVTEPDNGDVYGPRTSKCQVYTCETGGTTFKVIDTPGLRDDASANLPVLREIAATLERNWLNKSNPWVTGALYFHRITDRRITGAGKLGLDIFKAMVGEGFYSRIACVTTMWDTIKPEKREPFMKLSNELSNELVNFGGGDGLVFDLKGHKGEIETVLNYFVARSRNRRWLEFEREIGQLGSGGYRRTVAGKEVVRKAKIGLCVIL
ncbi:hypothetical protein B0T24DRAFT_119272 [Lasiosphaeria ovina]|uniref:G domain-containing protein n=1 Tax=Lasiosphaeria ovina TaxID=92902 RepID=A0AAE0JT42_9PEZI|nr:hypothetical protein B0T24DRAFT_119272 [Lasiosphaeria ovina]